MNHNIWIINIQIPSYLIYIFYFIPVLQLFILQVSSVAIKYKNIILGSMYINTSPITSPKYAYSPHNSVKSNISSKAFFSNIKAQLVSIRTDIHNLVSTTKNNRQTNTPKKCQINSPKFSCENHTYLNRSKVLNQNSYESYRNNRQQGHGPIVPRLNIRGNIGPTESGSREIKLNSDYYQEKTSKDMMETQTSNSPIVNNVGTLQLPLNGKEVNPIVKTQIQFNKEIKRTQDLQKMTSIRLQNSMDILREKYKEQQDKHNRQLAKYQHEIAESIQNLEAKDIMNRTLQKQMENLRQSHSRQVSAYNKQLQGKNEKIKQLELSLDNYIRLYEDAIRNSEISQIKGKNEELELRSQSERDKNHFKELGKEYQDRIDTLFDQNYQLKNKITHYQNEAKLAKFKISSLEATIQAYNENIEANRVHNSLGVAEMKNQISTLQTQIRQMEETYELQIMKLENQIDQLRGNSCNSQQKPLNSLVKDQIAEIQSLRAKLRDKNERIDRTRL